MINIIPEPFKYSMESGTFNMLKGFTIRYPDIWRQYVEDFTDFVKMRGLKSSTDSLNCINIMVSDKLAREGYLLDIADNSITISASTEAGCIYALASLKQLVVAHNGIIPCYKIEDIPRFNYRGFMLDVGRYFYSVEDVKKILDIMAFHKLNYFHWHLTEDQGWRIEIKKYPKLTEESSRRSHTNFNLIPHKGFYTQDEVREVVRYAHSLNIKVIPEIDMPGHMQAALHAYPDMGCFDRKLPVATHWGVKHDILCGGKQRVREFIKNIIDEIVELFPDKLIHIGGDEANKSRWNICENCQNAIRILHLKDENELQAHFINEINEHIKSKGYTAIMWNEDVPTEILSKDIIWMAWNVPTDKRSMIKDAMDQGRLVINASSEPNYLDLPYSINSLEKIYKQDVNFVSESDKMIGLEAPLWTEFVPNMKNAMWKIFPRIAAFAEVGWSDEKNRNYDNFLSKMPNYYEMLAMCGVTHVPSVKRANPKGARASMDNIWWSRRMLTWHGLHNLIDDAKVKHIAKKKSPQLFLKKDAAPNNSEDSSK